MNDENLTSSGFDIDSNESLNSHASAALNKQNEKFEIQRLRQINEQLQNSLESMKKQLKEALDSSSSSKITSESLVYLKQQLQDSNEKREKLIQQIKSMKSNCDEEHAKIAAELSQMKDERDSLNEHLEKKKKEIATLKGNAAQSEQLMEMMSENIRKNKQQKKKLKEKLKSLITQTDDLTAKLQTKDVEIQQANDEVQKHVEENAALTEKCNNLEFLIGNKDQQIDELKKEISTHQGVYSELEGQLESQEHELKLITEERKKILDLVGILQNALSKSAEIINKLKQEKKEAELQKKTIARQNALTNADVLDLKLPFEGELSDDMEKILKLPQYQPIQKIQLIINKASKHISDTEEQLRQLKKAQIDHENTKLDDETTIHQSAYLLKALLEKFSQIVTNNEDNNLYDPKTIEFFAKECSTIDAHLKDLVMNDPAFVPNDFFTTDDASACVAVLQQIANSQPAVYSLLISQLLLNRAILREVSPNGEHHQQQQTQQNNQHHHHKQGNKEEGKENQQDSNNNNKEEQATKEQQDNQQQSAPVQREKSEPLLKPTGDHATIETLNNQIKTLEEEKAKLRSTLKATKVQLFKLNQTDNEHQTEIAQLQLENNSLKNDLEVCKMKLEISANQAAQRQNDLSNISSFVAKTKDDSESSTSGESKAQLKADLTKKNAECTELRNIIDNLQKNIATLTKQNKKQHKKLTESFNTEKEALVEEIEQLRAKNTKVSKACNKKLKSAEVQFNTAYSQLQTQLDQTSEELTKAQNELQQKVEEFEAIKQKIATLQNEYNEKIQKLEKENNDYVVSTKDLKIELANTKQQMQKDKQHNQCQLSAQMMAYETKIQQMEQEVKSNTNKAIEDIYSVMDETFGQMYGLEAGDLNEDTFKQLVMSIKGDLEKLKYFQCADTQFEAEK